MKILFSHQLEGIGGGSRFQANIEKSLKRYFPDTTITHDIARTDYDVLFIVSPTSIKDFGFIDRAKEMGKRIVTRIDNQPKPSRNKRYRIKEKMARLGEISDAIIFQSEWAKDYVGWNMAYSQAEQKGFIKEGQVIRYDEWQKIHNQIQAKGKVIHNGVDFDLFNTTGKRRDFRQGKKVGGVHLIMISSSDPCKRLHEALDIFSQEHRNALDSKKPAPKLIIAGRLPDGYHIELMNNNWDFVRGENVEYIGQFEKPEEVAEIMKGCTDLIHVSFQDACSNTILEARACNLNVIASMTGGTPEIMQKPSHKIGLNIMASEYYKVFENKKW